MGFLLPKFVHHPLIFDFLCVALEDATLTDAILKVPFEAGQTSLAYKSATAVGFDVISLEVDLLAIELLNLSLPSDM